MGTVWGSRATTAGSQKGRHQARQGLHGLKQVLARFDAERQGLSPDGQPNIAKVF